MKKIFFPKGNSVGKTQFTNNHLCWLLLAYVYQKFVTHSLTNKRTSVLGVFGLFIPGCLNK